MILIREKVKSKNKKMKQKEYKKLLELKRECGFWGRKYVNWGKFVNGLNKLNNLKRGR